MDIVCLRNISVNTLHKEMMMMMMIIIIIIIIKDSKRKQKHGKII